MLYYTSSPQETAILAQKVAGQIDKGCFIAFRGDLGAGKTAFVSALAAALGSRASTGSPTFALLNQYTDGRIPVYHFDLYRINGEEIYSLGFDELFFDENAVCCVEWSERLSEDDMPKRRLDINIMKLEGDKRCFDITPKGYKEGEINI